VAKGQRRNREHTDEGFRRYMREIQDIPVLSRTEEQVLIRKAKDGDDGAAERLILSNLRFVVTIAHEYKDRGVPMLDLISQGNLGLMKALETFDPSRGLKFITYAVWWIRQAMLQAIADHARVVRIPQNRLATMRRIETARRELQKTHQRDPVTDEIGQSLGMGSEEVLDTLQLIHTEVSLEQSLQGESESQLKELIPNPTSPRPDDCINAESLGQDLEDAFRLLTEREAMIIRLYYGLEREQAHSLGTIGERFNLSRERVRQIRDQALRKLRLSGEIVSRLREYLG
jgi:RNA polymerase primary sigma factor